MNDNSNDDSGDLTIDLTTHTNTHINTKSNSESPISHTSPTSAIYDNINEILKFSVNFIMINAQLHPVIIQK